MDTKMNLTPTLDRIEHRLPPIGRQVFRLQRSVTAASVRLMTKSASAVGNAARSVGTSAAVGTRTVTGQAKAQVSQTAAVAEEQTIDLLDAATDAVDGKPSGSYDSWTRDELYERAQELDLDGRSTMSKRELIAALRS